MDEITARPAGLDGRRRSRAVLLVLLTLFCLAAAGIFWSWRHPVSHAQTELPVLGTVGEFTLTAEDGREVNRSFLQGRITVCQLVCSRCGSPGPLLLSRFAELDQNFNRSSRLQLLSVTIDPQVDQPPVLARLRESYEGSDHWVFLTGDPAEITRFAAGVFGTAPALRGDRLRQAAIDAPVLVLVDEEARIRQRYQGLDQEVVAAILEDVGTLLRNGQTSAKYLSWPGTSGRSSCSCQPTCPWLWPARVARNLPVWLGRPG
ncbi:MAG: SCO family protein [Verrucomicrobia bacterium]|nr:SCO family protein [Verrucomicrobiota bacterium]